MSDTSDGPLDPAIVEARGGRDRLVGAWEFVRKAVAAHAGVRSKASKDALEALLRQVAFELAMDVKHILPRKQYPALWRSDRPGYFVNPVFCVTLVPARQINEETIERLIVLDDKLVRFLQTCDAVLSRLRSPQQAVKVVPAASPPDSSRAVRSRATTKSPTPIRWSIDVDNNVTVWDDNEVEVVLSPALGQLFLAAAEVAHKSLLYKGFLRSQMQRGIVRTSQAAVKKTAYRVKKKLGTWFGQHWECDGTSAWWRPPEGSGATLRHP